MCEQENKMGRYRKTYNSQGQLRWSQLWLFTYGLVLAPAALADGSTISGTITIDVGNPFILTELRCLTDADSATVTNIQQLLFSIVDGSNQMLFSNIAIPREHMFGTRDFPRQLPSEMEIPPADTLTVTMTNKTGGALSTNVRVSLSGYRLVGSWAQKPDE
jgi:hypothetical protein